MTIVVTGATGFIGRQLLQSLREAGAEGVVPAGRSGQPLPLDLAASAFQLPSGTTAVLHLAGEKRDASRMQAVNADGAEELVAAAARAGATHFVHLSSVGVYGAAKHAGVVDEAFRHTPRGPYEVSKDSAEGRVRARCAALGLKCAVLQPSNVIGSAEHRPLLGLVRAIARGRYICIGPGDAWVNYVAVEDVSGAIIAALQRPASGTWIVNTPCMLTQMVDWIADELGCRASAARIPAWLGALAAMFGAAGRTALRREMPFSPERYREMTNTTRYDGRAIERDLGFAYATGIERSVRSLAGGYRRDGLA